MPELSFKGKEFVFNHHLAVPHRPLVPDAAKSVGEPRLDGNLIIHGDNLHALKSLLPMYAGKVDCIFIDPPYNTGNEGWCYNDNVNSPMMQQWLNENPVGIEDGLRHDKWCAMMWPRLRLLYDLLSESGALFVCIGDHEAHRLRMLLDEVFGADKFAACLVWQSRAKPSNIGDAKVKPQNDAEYIFVYEKVKDAVRYNLVHSGFDRSYPHTDSDGSYRTQTILKSNRGENERETMRFEINGYTPPPDQRWQGGKDFIQGLFDSNRMEFREGIPFRKYYEHEEADEHSPFYCYVPRSKSGTAESGKGQLNDILGNQHGMDTIKPTGIVRYCLNRIMKPNSIILDSFAGSGTTAHAVLEANKEDGGTRKFILIECEEYADRLTAERIRKVAQGYKYEGTRREELFRKSVTFSDLKKADKLLAQISSIENLEGHRFDDIEKKVKDGELLVEGVKAITERVEGLGGSFTYCTLGDAVDMDKMLSGESLPSFEQLGALLFHMATNEAIDPGKVFEENGHGYLGESPAFHVWLIYKPELDFLKSRDSALTLAKAKALAETKPGKRHLVFAPAKFVSQKLLDEASVPVEFVPLPWALYRVERG
jgi:adenine-specific DNA-methyltransferase